MPSTVGQRGGADGTATPLRDDSDFLQRTLTSVGDIVEKSGPRYATRGGHGGAVAAGSGFGLLNEPDVQLAGQPSGPRLGHAHDRWARPPQNWSAPLSAAACVTGRRCGAPTSATRRRLHRLCRLHGAVRRAVGVALAAWCRVGVRGNATLHSRTPGPAFCEASAGAQGRETEAGAGQARPCPGLGTTGSDRWEAQRSLGDGAVFRDWAVPMAAGLHRSL